MRASGALLMIVAILALAIGGLSFQSQAVEDPAVVNGTNTTADAYNLTEDVTQITTGPLATILVWGAFIAVALGIFGLIAIYGRGGR